MGYISRDSSSLRRPCRSLGRLVRNPITPTVEPPSPLRQPCHRLSAPLGVHAATRTAVAGPFSHPPSPPLCFPSPVVLLRMSKPPPMVAGAGFLASGRADLGASRPDLVAGGRIWWLPCRLPTVLPAARTWRSCGRRLGLPGCHLMSPPLLRGSVTEVAGEGTVVQRPGW